jgi:demethylmenaquinone methyltransferase/2-methoxy-6-polyprenyl-1,4-benzoquinol methylase
VITREGSDGERRLPRGPHHKVIKLPVALGARGLSPDHWRAVERYAVIGSLPCEPEVLRRRYNVLAPWYVAFEWILWLPGGIRERAVRLLDLRRGQRVLEVGCGTGRNFRFLRAVLGPEGHIYGVDLSEGMLARCRALCDRRGWSNVTLVRADALDYRVPEPLDAALFSLSYGTMLHRVRILDHVWSQLGPEGRLVIMEGKLMPGLGGKLLRPLVIPLMKATVLGDPDHEAWKALARLTKEVHLEEWLFGSYVICRGAKPLA